MVDFGWKKKAERLRMVIVSGAHPIAKELPPGMAKILDAFRRVAQTGDGRGLHEEINDIPIDAELPLWEPAEIHGWKFQATLYRKDGALWWLVRAILRGEREPGAKDLVFMDKVLEHLGAVPRRHAIIEPITSPPGEPRIPFGWWTWQNHWPLFDVQTKGYGKQASMRIVPLGTRETDGYKSLDMAGKDTDKDDNKP